MVCSTMRTEVVGFSTSVGSSWIFLIVLESTYEGGVKSAFGMGYTLYDLISVYGFLPKDLWIFPGGGVGLIYVGMPVQYVVHLPRTWI
jgi:hypothetical protein